jgi:hypothetical protein
LILDIENPTVSSDVVSSAIATHLVALPALHWQGPAQVEMQGRTAILRGVVASAHDRDLAERVVRLEATVDQVQNLIEVAALAGSPAAVSVRVPPVQTPAADNSAAGSAGNSVPGSSGQGNSVQGNSAQGPSQPRAGSILPPLPSSAN